MTVPPFEPPVMPPACSLPKDKQSSNKGIWIIAGITITAVVVVAVVGAFLATRSRDKDTPEEVVGKYLKASCETGDVGVIEKLIKPEDINVLKGEYGDSYKEKMREVYCLKALLPNTYAGVKLDYDNFRYLTSYEDDSAMVTVTTQGTVTRVDDQGRTTVLSLKDVDVSPPSVYFLMNQDDIWYLDPHYKYDVYLSDGISQDETQALLDRFKGSQNAADADIEYVSKAEALEEFKEMHPENPEMWPSLEENPLPASIRIVSPSLINLVHIEQSLQDNSHIETSELYALYGW